MQFIMENPQLLSVLIQLLSVLIAVVGGVSAFIKWIDNRNRALKEERYSKYMGLIGTISGNNPDRSTPRITQQIAAVWFLLEYKEYHKITYKIFSLCDLKNMANEPWTKHVVPHIEKLLQEIEQ